MEYTDKYFVFPIRIYDGESLKREHMQKERLESLGLELSKEDEEDARWVEGEFEIPYSDLEDLMFHEGYSKERGIDVAIKKGHDITVVIHRNFGELECTWKKSKFKEELNKFAKKYEASIMEEISKIDTPVKKKVWSGFLRRG